MGWTSFFLWSKVSRKWNTILVDEGFRKFSEVFVGWHEEGLMPAEGGLQVQVLLQKCRSFIPRWNSCNAHVGFMDARKL